jgi:hypothetical protein
MEDKVVEVVSYPSHLFISDVLDRLDNQRPLLIKDQLKHVDALRRWTLGDCQVLFGPSVKVNVINDKGENVKILQTISSSDFNLTVKNSGNSSQNSKSNS